MIGEQVEIESRMEHFEARPEVLNTHLLFATFAPYRKRYRAEMSNSSG